MAATLKLTHKAIGAEVRRGTYDIVVDGQRAGSLKMNDTIEWLGTILDIDSVQRWSIWIGTLPGDRQHGCPAVEFGLKSRSAEFFGEPDQKAFGPADVAEPIRIFSYWTTSLLTSSAPCLRSRASVSSMSSTANMTRR
jgi:hypothetical protein